MSTYEKRAVLFLDILGFKDLIKRNCEDLVIHSLSLTKEIQGRYPFDNSQTMQISAFSDCIAISVKTDTTKSNVVQLIHYANHLWWRLFARGVLSRGGIAVGDLYHQDGIIFGPALNNAYELENSIAIYPRIVLSEEVPNLYFDEWAKEHHGSVPMIEFGFGLLRKDFDGFTHVNVLGDAGHCPSEFLPPRAQSANNSRSYSGEELNQAKWMAVERFLQSRPTDRRAAAKYDWLAKYLASIIGAL